MYGKEEFGSDHEGLYGKEEFGSNHEGLYGKEGFDSNHEGLYGKEEFDSNRCLYQLSLLHRVTDRRAIRKRFLRFL